MFRKPFGLHTQAIHGGHSPEPGAVAEPLYQTASFSFRDAHHAEAAFAPGSRECVYTRWGNPTLAACERKLALLEGGEAAMVFASGMAAVSTTLLSLVVAGDHLVVSRGLYSASFTFCTRRLASLGVEVSVAPPDDLQAFHDAIQPRTKVVLIETPANPTLRLTDIRAVADLAQSVGATLLMDNTFATPINQRPLALGASAVIHSATKYLGGHGDLIGGVVVSSADFCKNLWATHIEVGGVLSPFNAFLLQRGLQTLPLRVARHNANALAVAHALEGRPEVAWVAYPGLESHPQHALALRQMKGFGGMLCFELAGGIEAGRRLIDRVELCTRAVSLGDVKTLICHPASSTHSQVSTEDRRQAGVTDGLIRLSVGLEDPEDLIADLLSALADT